MTGDELRMRAEGRLRLTRRDVKALPQAEVYRLIHELQVHQIELEMQNEALRASQLENEEARLRYQQLFDCAPVGYVMLDHAGSIVRINAAGRALLRERSLHPIGRALRWFIVPEDGPRFDEHLRAALPSSRVSCEVRLQRRGERCDVRLDVSVLPSPTADQLVVLTDISERKRNLEATVRLNHELEERVASRTALLAAQNERLADEVQRRTQVEAQQVELQTRLRRSERLESVGLLAAGIAHDFNNLLVSVLGNADLLLLSPDLAESFRPAVSRIKRAGQLAAELTRQLLIFAGRGRMSTAAVELTTLLAEQVELLRTRIPAGVRLEARIPPELPPVEADRGQLSQVVMNLAINAVEAVGEVGAVVVETRVMRFDAAELETFQLNHVVAPGDFVVLGVEDNGPGIDEATLQKIFDPFFTTKFTGRGLGLASVAGIVQSHRGALRVRTRLGEGTRIEVALRLAERRAESERPPALQEPEWKGSGSVLLIDDDDLVRRAIADLLRRLGFEVRAAASGEAGLELYGQAEPRFKLVMLDWIMPGMSGAKVLAELRRLDPELPVILISGYSAEDLASYDARAVCLQKPMTFSVLRSAVRSQLEKHVASNVAEVRLA